MTPDDLQIDVEGELSDDAIDALAELLIEIALVQGPVEAGPVISA